MYCWILRVIAASLTLVLHVRRPMGQRGECEQTAGHLHIYHRSNYREKRRAVTHALSTGGRLAALRTSSCRGIRLFAKITRQIRIMRYIYGSSKDASHSRLSWDPRRAP